MLTIRLQRTGKRNAASFRIVVAEKTAHVSKKFQEVLGTYNPRDKQFNLKNPERVQYWISQHIEISPTMHNLLIDKGLLKADKIKAFKIKKKAETEVKAAAAPAPAAASVDVPAETAAPSSEQAAEAKETSETKAEQEPAANESAATTSDSAKTPDSSPAA
jgi:small subunit ribosomal protein S16